MPHHSVLMSMCPAHRADYVQYAVAFMAAGFRTPKELATVTEADVLGVPKGAVRLIAKSERRAGLQAYHSCRSY